MQGDIPSRAVSIMMGKSNSLRMISQALMPSISGRFKSSMINSGRRVAVEYRFQKKCICVSYIKTLIVSIKNKYFRWLCYIVVLIGEMHRWKEEIDRICPEKVTGMLFGNTICGHR